MFLEGPVKTIRITSIDRAEGDPFKNHDSVETVRGEAGSWLVRYCKIDPRAIDYFDHDDGSVPYDRGVMLYRSGCYRHNEEGLYEVRYSRTPWLEGAKIFLYSSDADDFHNSLVQKYSKDSSGVVTHTDPMNP